MAARPGSKFFLPGPARSTPRPGLARKPGGNFFSLVWQFALHFRCPFCAFILVVYCFVWLFSAAYLSSSRDILTISATSCECGRQFSKLHRLITDYRSDLSSESVFSNLIANSLASKKIAF
jgi:hypothetical protein